MKRASRAIVACLIAWMLVTGCGGCGLVIKGNAKKIERKKREIADVQERIQALQRKMPIIMALKNRNDFLRRQIEKEKREIRALRSRLQTRGLPPPAK